MGDHLKPVNMGPPVLRVNRRREGHGQRQHDQSEQQNGENAQQKPAPVAPQPKTEAQKAAEKTHLDFNKLLKGEH